MSNRILAVIGNVADVGFGVVLVINAIITFFHFYNFLSIIASLFLTIIGIMIIVLEVVEITQIRELFSIYWLFIGRGLLYLFLGSVGGGTGGWGLFVFIFACAVAGFWLVARFLGLTHEDVHPITSSSSSYRPVGEANNQATA
eukprot:TRINITY_DN3741_c0_g1_i2.p1 TRINITY_DN3741_c0_g1~~TRINITY_DN3741_c0_g1_i2.p1  ORF type:complete len:143 (+),score=34.15 TRINITY_DN3741_c0_g1_i2:148-576(+)